MPKHEETGMVEADITINGAALSFAESMAVRVAISSFRMSLPHMASALGPIADNYDRLLRSIEETIFLTCK